MSHDAPESWIDPAVLAQIGDLPLLARTVVTGFLHGLHRSLRSGLSLDFSEHRPYQPGDDLRRLDWRLLGRTDRYYLKTYEADTNADVMFALDASASMDFGSSAVTKFTYARMLVASLAWLSQHQGDRVGLVTLTDRIVEVVPPSARHLPLLLQALGRAHARGAGAVPAALDTVVRFGGRPGIVVLATDCYEEPAVLRRAAGALRARGNDVIVFHVQDPAERDLPWHAPANFEDSETGDRMPLRPDTLRDEYQRIVGEHRAALRRELGRDGIDYVEVDTDRPLDVALRQYLDLRALAAGMR